MKSRKYRAGLVPTDAGSLLFVLPWMGSSKELVPVVSLVVAQIAAPSKEMKVWSGSNPSWSYQLTFNAEEIEIFVPKHVLSIPPHIIAARQRLNSLNKGRQRPTSETKEPKRRRTADKVPDLESPQPQWEQQLEVPKARQDELVQRPWATVNQPMAPVSRATGNGVNGSSSTLQSPEIHTKVQGWATVNRPPPPPPIQSLQKRQPDGGRGYGGGAEDEEREREETMPNEDDSALIDSLPKSKQRQVYGMISGLQGGLEHIQRELNSLKNALGIDDQY